MDTDSNFQISHSTRGNNELHTDRKRAIVDFELRFGATDHAAQTHLPRTASNHSVHLSFACSLALKRAYSSRLRTDCFREGYWRWLPALRISFWVGHCLKATYRKLLRADGNLR